MESATAKDSAKVDSFLTAVILSFLCGSSSINAGKTNCSDLFLLSRCYEGTRPPHSAAEMTTEPKQHRIIFKVRGHRRDALVHSPRKAAVDPGRRTGAGGAYGRNALNEQVGHTSGYEHQVHIDPSPRGEEHTRFFENHKYKEKSSSKAALLLKVQPPVVTLGSVVHVHRIAECSGRGGRETLPSQQK